MWCFRHNEWKWNVLLYFAPPCSESWLCYDVMTAVYSIKWWYWARWSGGWNSSRWVWLPICHGHSSWLCIVSQQISWILVHHKSCRNVGKTCKEVWSLTSLPSVHLDNCVLRNSNLFFVYKNIAYINFNQLFLVTAMEHWSQLMDRLSSVSWVVCRCFHQFLLAEFIPVLCLKNGSFFSTIHSCHKTDLNLSFWECCM